MTILPYALLICLGAVTISMLLCLIPADYRPFYCGPPAGTGHPVSECHLSGGDFGHLLEQVHFCLKAHSWSRCWALSRPQPWHVISPLAMSSTRSF